MADETTDKGKHNGKKKAGKDYKNLNGRQKAAIFLVAIGSDVSSEVMKHLREDEVEQLTFEIARLETVDADFKEQVLEEFQELMQAQNFITSGGIDYARELLEKSLGSQKAIDIINRLTSSLQVRPFDFIRRTDPTHLLNFVQQEYPQTIALILAIIIGRIEKGGKILLVLTLAANVGVLLYYKYMSYVASITPVDETAAADAVQTFIMPLGISFFTFQQIMYVVNVYRKEINKVDIIDYLSYITYFPKLIMGPMVEPVYLIDQINDTEKRTFNWDNFAVGLKLFSFGLFKKMVLADTFTRGVTWGFTNIDTATAGDMISRKKTAHGIQLKPKSIMNSSNSRIRENTKTPSRMPLTISTNMQASMKMGTRKVLWPEVWCSSRRETKNRNMALRHVTLVQ